MPEVIARRTVFETPWFTLVEKSTVGLTADAEPAAFYAVQSLDYVTVVAMTALDEVVLVRQYRPVVEDYTIELPAGHVEIGQTPEQAARQELLEETGFVAEHFELLGTLLPDTGRLGNRMWCYLARNAVAHAGGRTTTEPIDTLLVRHAELLRQVREGEFTHALHIATMALMLLRPEWSTPVGA